MRNRIIVLAALAGLGAAAIASTAALAQDGGRVPRSSSPRGLEIHGGASMTTNASSIGAVAVGKGNKAETAAGSVQGDTRIHGHTRMTTTAKDVNTSTIGKGNKAASTIGGIGQ